MLKYFCQRIIVYHVMIGNILKPCDIINTRLKTWILCTSVASYFMMQLAIRAWLLKRKSGIFLHARAHNQLFIYGLCPYSVCMSKSIVRVVFLAKLFTRAKAWVHISLLINNATSIRGKWEWFERVQVSTRKLGSYHLSQKVYHQHCGGH